MKSNWFKQLKKRKAFLLNIWWQFVPAAAKINSVIVVYGATGWTLNFSTSVWTASCRTPPAGSEHREKRKVVSSLWHKPTEKHIRYIFTVRETGSGLSPALINHSGFKYVQNQLSSHRTSVIRMNRFIVMFIFIRTFLTQLASCWFWCRVDETMQFTEL